MGYSIESRATLSLLLLENCSSFSETNSQSHVSIEEPPKPSLKTTVSSFCHNFVLNFTVVLRKSCLEIFFYVHKPHLNKCQIQTSRTDASDAYYNLWGINSTVLDESSDDDHHIEV